MMSETMNWIIMIMIGLGTLALRLSFIQLGGLIQLPEQAARMLRFVPAAALSALVAPPILRGYDGTYDFSLVNAHIPAAIVAAIIAWKTKGMLLSLAGGMAVLWTWQAVI